MRQLATALVAHALLAGQAFAEPTSELLYAHKSWEVRLVGYEDGTKLCIAQVWEGDSDSFSVISDAASAIRLQFYSDAWEFGEGDTANLEVLIDRRAPWTMTNAELYKQSVLFDIPDSDDGVSFLTEVMAGNRLTLNNEQGEYVQAYTLSGSAASIQALVQCVQSLGRPTNPFN